MMSVDQPAGPRPSKLPRLVAYWPEALFVVGILSALSLVLERNYLLFHLCVELFTVVVGFTAVAIAWNTRTANQSSFLAFIGLSFPSVAVLDLLHAAAYPGMGIFSDQTPNLSIQLWLAARFIQSASFLAALVLAERRMRTGDVLLSQAAALAAALMAIFLFDALPDGHAPDVGLTAFKIVSEYVVIALSAAGCVLLWRLRDRFSPGVFVLTMAGFALAIPQELAFTLYTDPHGTMNAAGHYLKLLSFYLLYKAIIVTALRYPYDLIFYRMCRSDEALRDHLANLESIVTTRTAELRESEARWRALLECSNDWFWETDEEGRFTALSPRAEETVGRAGSDLLGFRHDDLLDPARPAEDFPALLDAQRRRLPFRRLSYPLAAPGGGEPRWVMVSGVPRHDPAGRFVGYRGTSSDITARRAVAETVRRKQTMAALGSLVGGLAHEINNLLQPVVSLSELARRRVKNDERLALYLDTIHDSGVKARTILRDVLSFARVEVAQSPPADLDEAIRSALALARPDLPAGIVVTTRIAGDLPPVTITATEMTQVLLNLLKNAGDAMPEGGRLNVEADAVVLTVADTARRGLPDGSYVRVSVSDTGSGMDEETRQRVFEPFFTTKPVGEGTGLGLAVVYGIVRNGGGDVTVRSLVARGTTVVIELPIASPHARIA